MQKLLAELLEFGILNIDKPSGPTSFGVVEYILKKLKLRKASHFGTLDPKVTGVLPIALNRACKLTGYFLGSDKEYIGIMRLHEDVSLEKLKEKINEKFLGKIKQTPPVKSRVKRQEREREIHEFELLEVDGKDILFRVKCEGGTYIRKLIDDLGTALGIGAHMLELRRIKAGIFSEDDENFVNLYDFDKADEKELRKIILPAEEAIKKKFKTIQVKESEISRLYTGKQIFQEDIIDKSKIKSIEGDVVGVFSKEKFIGMYRVINKGKIFAKSEFVMQPVKKQNNL